MTETRGRAGEEADTPRGLADLEGELALVEMGPVQATGRVSRADESTLTVTCDEQPWSAEEWSPVTVSVFARDALYRLEGPATLSGHDVITGPGATVERIQRRRWPRRRLDLAVTLCPVEAGARLEGIPGRTVDVGIGGICVETLRAVEGDGDPMVILSLPDGTAVVSAASTVAVEDLGDGWRYRLVFRALDVHDASRLAELTMGQDRWSKPGRSGQPGT